MNEFRSYLPDAIINENLAETAGRLAMIAEQEHAHIAELAAEILTDSQPSADLIASLPDRRPAEMRLSYTVPNENAAVVRHMQTLHEVWRDALLCAELRSGWGLERRDAPTAFFSDLEEAPPIDQSRVIYQRTGYADLAYRYFSKMLRAPSAIYTHSFGVVCEEVVRGNCEFCILPLENSSEGTFHSFTRLIDRFSLKIVAVCDVATDEQGRSTRFVLLSRSLLPLLSPITESTRFECSVPMDGDCSPASLLQAAQIFDLSLIRLDARPVLSEDIAIPATHFVFEVGGGDLAAFLLYLAMRAPAYEPLGIYQPSNPDRKD